MDSLELYKIGTANAILMCVARRDVEENVQGSHTKAGFSSPESNRFAGPGSLSSSDSSGAWVMETTAMPLHLKPKQRSTPKADKEQAHWDARSLFGDVEDKIKL